MAASSPDQARAQQAAKDKANANKANASRDQKNSLETNFGGSQPKYFLDFDPSGRVRILQTLIGGETEQRFLIISPNGLDYSFANKTQVVKAIRNLYKNQKEALRKQLLDLGYITEREFNTRSETALNSGVLSAANEFTTEIVDAYTVEGVTKFPTFDKWISGRPAAGDDGKKDLPVRDINLMDRDVVEAIIRDVYMSELQKEVDPKIIKAKTDRYMEQIEKGTLTTIKEGSKEVVRKSTVPFSEAQVRAELGEEIPKENTVDYNRAQSLNFLTFLSGMDGK
jgi:hypothetical protein